MPLPPHDEVAAADVARYVEELSNWDGGAQRPAGLLELRRAGDHSSGGGAGVIGNGGPVWAADRFAPKPSAAEAAIPPLHFMQASGENAPAAGQGVAYDWVGLPLHGLYLTHLTRRLRPPTLLDGGMFTKRCSPASGCDYGPGRPARWGGGGGETGLSDVVSSDIPARRTPCAGGGPGGFSGADLELRNNAQASGWRPVTWP